MVLEYLSSNALNKYPFNDTATLQAVDSSYLSNNTFLDIIVASKKKEIIGAFLSSYISNTGSSTLTLVFTYFRSNETTIGTITLTVPFSVVLDKEFYGLANNDVAVKVVFGNGAVQDKLLSVSHTFTIATARLAQSAIILCDPRVTSVTFRNWNKGTNLPEASALGTVFGSEVTEASLTLREGANIAMAQLGATTTIDVLKGAGTGLYVPPECNDPVLTIKMIDEVGPNTNGNFLLVTDDCYTTTPAINGLFIDNICKPKCTAEQLSAFAHYLNRVNDGLSWVNSYATGISSALGTEITNFENNVIPTRNLPRYKVEFAKFPSVDSGIFYYSFAVGFFNPSNTAKTAAVTFSGGTIKEARFKVGNAGEVLSGTTVSKSVPCLKVGILEFITYATAGTVVHITGTFGSLTVNYTVTLP